MATRIIEPLQVDSYNGVEDWIERVDQAINCAIIQHNVEEKERPTFASSLLLANIGQSGYKVLKSYCAPRKPNELAYADLVKLLQDNLVPKLNTVSEGYLFNQMRQEPGEGLSLYISRLKEKANLCNFDTFYDRMVKDRFIFGLRDGKIRSYLLTKSEKDFDTASKVLALAIEKESALTANTAMSGSSNSANFVKKNNSSGKQFQKGGLTNLLVTTNSLAPTSLVMVNVLGVL